jgi:hypothetical protein
VDKHYPGFIGCYETQQHCASKKWFYKFF